MVLLSLKICLNFSRFNVYRFCTQHLFGYNGKHRFNDIRNKGAHKCRLTAFINTIDLHEREMPSRDFFKKIQATSLGGVLPNSRGLFCFCSSGLLFLSRRYRRGL